MKNLFTQVFVQALEANAHNFRSEATDSQSDLKELQVKFEAILSARADHVFKTFCKNCAEYEKSVN